MRGNIKSIELLTRKTKEAKEFKIIQIKVDVKLKNEMNKSATELKEYKFESGFERIKEYFKKCGLTSESAIGKEVDISLVKEEWVNKLGEKIISTKIKYLNFLDENDKVIKWKEKNNEIGF